MIFKFTVGVKINFSKAISVPACWMKNASYSLIPADLQRFGSADKAKEINYDSLNINYLAIIKFSAFTLFFITNHCGPPQLYLYIFLALIF